MNTSKNKLKILHTSDWHLGRRLYGYTRYAEFSAFLDWLYKCVIEQEIDVLIIAGDIFDTMTPSNKAQSLYYEFLGRISHSCCQHVIIVAGNHDSPSLIDAPKEVLKFLDVHVIGTVCSNIEDEVITLTDPNNHPQAIILAIPYLRDKDVRHSQSGESSTDKQAHLVAGIAKHYAEASQIAKERQKIFLEKYGQKVPIIATGHLMALGGKTTSDDGVRDLYIGNLGGVSANIFDPIIDYVALGHLHVPQMVGGNEHIRYSGSPIAMGFGEAMHTKQVLLVEFAKSIPSSQNMLSGLSNKDKLPDSSLNKDTNFSGISISPIHIPTFLKMAQIKGDLGDIKQQIDELKTLNKPIWTEVIYHSDDIISNLAEQLQELVKDSQIKMIKIKNNQIYQKVLKQTEDSESLHDLTSEQVFERCLETHEISKSQRNELITCFQQVVYEIENEDKNIE